MVKSYVLMQVPRLRENEVLIKLSKLDEVADLNSLFGEYNLMVKVEAEDYKSIGEIIVNKIKTIDGIKDMKTLIGL